MEKIFIIATIVFLILVANISIACENQEPKEKSKKNYLHLIQKDQNSWEIIKNGSWGKMKYCTFGEEFEFIFNGYGLTPKQNYTLIYYPDPWPGNGLICLANSTANECGKIYMSESIDIGNLPSENDENNGAKIWLVLTSDVDCENSKMIGWNPKEYLFEKNLIYYSKTHLIESSTKCNDFEESKNSSEINQNNFDIKHISLLISSLSNSLDLLIDRFPIIEQIVQKILNWIFYILLNNT